MCMPDSFVMNLNYNIEVASCPFCKEHNLAMYRKNGLYPDKYIQCCSCGAKGPVKDSCKDEEIIELWNKCEESDK